MTTAVTINYTEVLLALLAIVSLVVFVSSLVTIRLVRIGVSFIILLVSLSLLGLTVAVQPYTSLNSNTKVATITAHRIESIPHDMTIDVTLYDQDGNITQHSTYNVQGDRWTLQGDRLQFTSWLQVVGIHSGYKLTRLEGEYENANDEATKDHTVIMLNGGEDNLFTSVHNQAWSSPYVQATNGTALILPADGITYNILLSNTGLHAQHT